MASRLSFPLNVKYASVFNEKDHAGDIVVKGAFKESLQAWRTKKALPPVLWQHQQSEPIGIYKTIEEDDHGLYVEGQLLVDEDPNAKRIHAHLKAGSISGLSIGFILKDYDTKADAFYIKALDLLEISLVTIPANDSARIIDVKGYFERGEIPAPSLIEKALRDVGFSRKQAKAFMAEGLNALLPRDASDKTKATQAAFNEALGQLKNLQTHLA